MNEWAGNGGKSANVADATTVIWPVVLYGRFARTICCCDFLLLVDVNERINYRCARDVLTACFVNCTFVTGLLIHIRQKEKIALEIAGESLW
jgi:hypothetical protein